MPWMTHARGSVIAATSSGSPSGTRSVFFSTNRRGTRRNSEKPPFRNWRSAQTFSRPRAPEPQELHRAAPDGPADALLPGRRAGVGPDGAAVVLEEGVQVEARTLPHRRVGQEDHGPALAGEGEALVERARAADGVEDRVRAEAAGG